MSAHQQVQTMSDKNWILASGNKDVIPDPSGRRLAVFKICSASEYGKPSTPALDLLNATLGK